MAEALTVTAVLPVGASPFGLAVAQSIRENRRPEVQTRAPGSAARGLSLPGPRPHRKVG
jgi:hypothetical protein